MILFCKRIIVEKSKELKIGQRNLKQIWQNPLSITKAEKGFILMMMMTMMIWNIAVECSAFLLWVQEVLDSKLDAESRYIY